MGIILVFSILSLENIRIYDIFGKWPKLTNWGFQGQIGHFDIFIVNYDKLAYLELIGIIGIEN